MANHARPVAQLERGIIGRILHCAAGSEWCKAEIEGYRGYLKRAEFWGTFAGEAVSG